MTHTLTYTEKHTQKRRRRRAIPYIFGNDRLDELLWQLLEDSDPRLRAYVYRLRDGQKIKPAFFIDRPLVATPRGEGAHLPSMAIS